ncbi:hypothetical protein BKA70DRAFT_1343227 [Coprinopsis sp. MPI-PUGE-AT-0042]|nr:hypothetical protein BKA70DRAFT_1343227 [Coprinopsis sp. MPI-PUGE-AT-0042]
MMGVGGAGKSTFVNTCIPGAGAPTNASLTPDAQGITAYHCQPLDCTLVDTPGFDNLFFSDGDNLQKIMEWITKQYPHNRGGVRCGIIFLEATPPRENRVLTLLHRSFRAKGICRWLRTPPGEERSYNGEKFESEEAAMLFCHNVVKAILNDLSVSELLEELDKVIKRVAANAGRRRTSLWRRLIESLSRHFR